MAVRTALSQVISSDDVRRDMQATGDLRGVTGEFDAGLYSPENVSAVHTLVIGILGHQNEERSP